jgi:ADP-ribose pyrophosphatase YjhB (NUDIX family)
MSRLHLTVAAVIENQGRFLLVEERAGGQIVFNQPAGHVEAGETLIQAVIREVREETAWEFEPQALLGFYQYHGRDGDSFYRACFCGQARQHYPQQVLDDSIIRAIWLSRDEVEACQERLRSVMVSRCIDDYLAGVRYPLEMLVNVN